MRRATSEEIANWDQLLLSNPDGGNPLQCQAFAETKQGHGWLPVYLYDENLKVATLALKKSVPILGDLWYAPKGPGVTTNAQLAKFAASVAGLESKPFLFKIEPELKKDEIIDLDHHAANSKQFVMVKAPRNIQYNTNTVVVDLKPTEDEILASFRQKTRYNVRLAEKKGVTVEAVEANETNLKQMYFLMGETQKRAGFFLRDYDYFHDYWAIHAGRGNGQLFFAKLGDQVLAGAFVSYFGPKALYKDGGSVREHSELQAPALMQWRIMQWLKQHGVTEYDLHGTPPADQIDNPKHPLAGLARFKTGFNAEVTEYAGTYDIALSSLSYRVWTRIGERIVAAYSIRVKKQLFY